MDAFVVKRPRTATEEGPSRDWRVEYRQLLDDWGISEAPRKRRGAGRPTFDDEYEGALREYLRDVALDRRGLVSGLSRTRPSGWRPGSVAILAQAIFCEALVSAGDNFAWVKHP